jgi:putative transposase
VVNRALQTEMTKHEPASNPTRNTSNGKSKKAIKGEFGELLMKFHVTSTVASNCKSSKHQARWTVFDDKIISLYVRGMTIREISIHLI